MRTGSKTDGIQPAGLGPSAGVDRVASGDRPHGRVHSKPLQTPLGPRSRDVTLVPERAYRAALENLDRALDAAVKLGTEGNKGKLRARLRAASSAVQTLESRARPHPLGRARHAAAQLAAELGATEPVAVELRDRLTNLEYRRVLSEMDDAQPGDAARVDAMVAATPDPSSVQRWAATILAGPEGFGKTAAELREDLDRDLDRGGLGEALGAHLRDRGVSGDDIERFFGFLAELRAGFLAGSEAPDAEPSNRDMQRTNWIHTRAEVPKAARAFDLVTPPGGHGVELLQTLLSSAASDAFKDASPHSLLWHNRPAAELVLPLLVRRHFDPQTARALLPEGKRLVHEHQITPALFMSGALVSQLTASGATPEVLAEVKTKVGAPLTAPRTNGEIDFSPEARDALAGVGLDGWATMDPASPHFARSQVVAFADVLQYVAADGVLKIAVDIRSPDHTAPFMRDPNIRAAIDSSVGFSFARGMEAIEDPRLLEAGEAAAARMQRDLGRDIYPEVERRLRRTLGVEEVDPLPNIPYWNQDVSTDGDLTDRERSSITLVKSTLQSVLAEHGNVSLDPFGTKDEA